MSDDLETVREFQRRRKITWNATKLWFILAAVGMIGMFWFGDVDSDSNPERFGAGILLFVLVGVSIVRITYIIRANYRCPACGAIPMSGGFSLGPSAIGYDKGVALNPKQCSGCGARLS